MEKPGRTRLQTVAAAVCAQAITLALLLGPLWGTPWLTGFRNYFSNDQLSYSAIATNVASGQSWFVEPFTETGSSFYPSAWYQLIGLVARITSLSVPTAWTLLGVVLVCATVLAFGLAAVRLSGAWWSPILPALALATGTLSMALNGGWYTLLDKHALLWGPFGMLFALNAEVAGVCLGALGLLLLLVTGSTTRTPRATTLTLVAAGVLIGVTANVHTYAFFTSVSLTALWAWAYGLLAARKAWLTATSVLVLALALVAGPWVAGLTGQTLVFGLLLASLLPPLVWLAVRSPRPVAALLIPMALTALPQILRTASGLAADDPFLSYRQASTEALSVPPLAGLAGAAVLIAVWLGCLMAPRRGLVITAFLTALPVGYVLMASNDRWGFDQEPYRFANQYFMVGLLMLAVIAPIVIRRDEGPRSRLVPSYVAVGVAALLFTVSLGDVAGFWRFAQEQGVFDTRSQRSQDLAAAGQRTSGLLTAGPCVDPQRLKLMARGPVTFFNRGMAWPTQVDDIQHIMNNQSASVLELPLLRLAGVRYIVTDTTCETDWSFTPRDLVVPIREVGDFRLWQLLPQ